MAVSSGFRRCGVLGRERARPDAGRTERRRPQDSPLENCCQHGDAGDCAGSGQTPPAGPRPPWATL